MGKKKKKKTESKKPTYVYELLGIALVLMGLFGIMKLGILGQIVASFSLFLCGCLYPIFPVALMVLGIIIIVIREMPKIFNSKVIGITLAVIGVLVLAHKNYIYENAMFSEIIKPTIDNVMIGIESIMNDSDLSLSTPGGGIIGALFAWGFNKLFALQGMKIVSIVLVVAGILLFTGLSIADIVKNTVYEGKKLIKHDKKRNSDDKKSNKPLIVDNNGVEESEKKVVTLHELTNNEENIEENKNESSSEVKINKKYQLPSLDLLEAPKQNKKSLDKSQIEKNIATLERVLQDFEITGKVVEVNIGPTVTQYEMELKAGTKVSKLLGINREIALTLAKKDVRIQAPIPGKNTVGIEMPNDVSQMVTLREVLASPPKKVIGNKLAVALGKNIMGKIEYCEINKTPHLLVAGSTGSGKSVCINGMIISILMNAKPDEVKMVLVDPKKVELSIYNGVPHLLTPVVTDPHKASIALKKIVSEMERRYDLFSETGSKNIESYNNMIENKNKKLSEDEKISKMPYIVVIVDELADLMVVARKEVEDSIMRITQMARAAGIHLIIATQRPSTDIITGVIKTNIPSRISFAVTSGIDSRTILDMVGAEKLIGRGDMLFLPMGESTPNRIQGAFISEEEIKKVVDHTISQQKAMYDDHFLRLDSKNDSLETKQERDLREKEDYDDPLYNEIVEFVVTQGKASTSLIQRRFKLGFNRAARIIDLLEDRGIVGPQNGSKPREVLVKLDEED